MPMEEVMIVQVNYWKEIRKEINRTFESLHGLVLLTHNSIEFTDIIDFLNDLRKHQETTILYISLISSYHHIKQILQNHPLPSKKLFVVDCVSGFLRELQDSDEVVYRKPPSNLDEMKNLIMKNIQWSNPNIIVVDSISQFINFTTPTDEELHNLCTFLTSIKEDALGLTRDVIVLLYDDKIGLMRKLPTMFTDVIMKLEVIKEKPQWKD
jgi:adenosyl cobinamide kinase/adenosyl cobinamide phosphate guanylyltransferase